MDVLTFQELGDLTQFAYQGKGKVVPVRHHHVTNAYGGVEAEHY
jgi:hypothetical protein